MSRLPAFVFAVAALALAASAGAQVYKWKDSKGVTHYSDSAPTNGVEYQRVQVSSGAATPVAAAPASIGATAATTTSNTTTASQPAPASTARIPDTAANRAKLCKDLDHNIGLLSSDQPLTSGDASSPQQNMSDVQRRQELATAQAQKQQYCH
ncbi:MAG TPA: DUF4124 domain-containing protein [Rhodanobacteraceae bacterium]|nr:DUF4124 domain-containing protein [Rhodanobacteraceae bacterium]